LRAVLALDGAVFLVAALLNWGLRIPLGAATLAFVPAVWQAGIGEAVVGVSLVAAAWTARRGLAWLGFWLSVIGIVFGLSSRAVQGAARDVHVVLVPLALVPLALLLLSRHRRAAGVAEG
jgi:heme/copper-type cytochrome/quinol oxidase subunit 1